MYRGTLAWRQRVKRSAARSARTSFLWVTPRKRFGLESRPKKGKIFPHTYIENVVCKSRKCLRTRFKNSSSQYESNTPKTYGHNDRFVAVAPKSLRDMTNTTDGRQERGDRRQETGDRREERGERREERGNRREERGERRQETESLRTASFFVALK